MFSKPSRQVDRVFVHCTATDNPAHDNIKTIRKWHTDPKPKGRGWSDIGSWSAIADLAADAEIGDTICVDTDDCYVRSDGNTLLAVVGVSGLLVVAHEGSVLVVPKDRAQDVKAIVNKLKADTRAERL